MTLAERVLLRQQWRQRRIQEDRVEAAAKAESDATHEEHERPRTRGDCKDGPRPCPWVSCKHHLYLDVNPESGTVKINFPDREPWELKDSCSLDVAARGGVTLGEVGLALNVTRERTRQLETRGLLAIKQFGRRLNP